MGSRNEKMALGVFIGSLGYHMASWRHPDAPNGGEMQLQHYINSLRIAERGKFDIYFLPDGSGVRGRDEPRGALSRSSRNIQFEPITLLCALAMCSSNIGLMATASTTYNEPSPSAPAAPSPSRSAPPPPPTSRTAS